MEDLEKDVQVDPSATDQGVIEDTPPQADIQEDVLESTPPAPQGNEAVDENGVPYKNRMFEWKRKAEDLAERLPSLVEEKINQAFAQQGNQAQKKEYTIAELERFAIENPEHRPWVEEEKAKVIRTQLAKEMDEKIQVDRKRQESDVRRQQSLKYVMDNYPEMFVKNSNGQITSWDNSHPLTQQIGVFMNDKRFADDPEGLMAAADIAYARMARGQQPIVNQQQKKLKQEVKDLQRKTMIEGGGKAAQPTSDPVRSSIDRLKSTGSMKDAEEAMAAIFDRAKKRAPK